MYSGKISFAVVFEHEKLTDFYLFAGLEISEGWEKESGVLFSEALFDCTSVKTAKPCCERDSLGQAGDKDMLLRSGSSCDYKNMIAAYSLSKRYGVTVLDYIAVRPEQRKSGIGSVLLTRIKDKCKKDGTDKIYLTAKAREFFLKNGARELSEKDALFMPLLGECSECAQRERDCFPAVMVLDV